MQETDLHYPPETCPFCSIAAAYPVSESAQAGASLWRSAPEQQQKELAACVPSDEESQADKTDPSSFVVLRSNDVVAFLDILPMTRGEFLFILFFPVLLFLLVLGGTGGEEMHMQGVMYEGCGDCGMREEEDVWMVTVLTCW